LKMSERVSCLNRYLVMGCERIIALALLVAVICFFLATLRLAFGLNWNSLATLHELGQRVLLMTIALELVRTLIWHDLGSIVNLMAFLVARRMLEPQTAFWEVPLGVVAFAVLMATRRYLMNGASDVAQAEE
jgi:hypothetical protein